ncbi:type II toxin-antitoxin system VapC family toxin [Pseudokineococcus basanitobsidens]|uniref:Ribonuclease VapC n=1 Tax=Pseudokineococcus basanitobsidens TaxID=1926649 RepID=A0ABU8RF77_9ACTN
MSGHAASSGPVSRRAVLDTSVFVARESGRPLDTSALPEETAVSVITVAELHAGVLAARDTATRARRMSTLDVASLVEPLPVTAEAARRWAQLRVVLAEQGRRAKVNDLWIAAVAAANDMDVVTQDDDFDAIAGAGGPAVVRV